MQYPFLLLCLLLVTSACTHSVAAKSSTKPLASQWRACLDSPGGEIGFQMELHWNGAQGEWVAWILNGSERIRVGETQWNGRAIEFHLHPYDSLVSAELEPGDQRLLGTWTRYGGTSKEYSMPFRAQANEPHRFPKLADEASIRTLAKGSYRVQFSEDAHHSVGLFEVHPDSNRVTGTFLTTLGDYRFLEGVLAGEDLVLSCFDGAHAFLFRAKVQADGRMLGDFWSRDAWHETWTAELDPQVVMPNAFELTQFSRGLCAWGFCLSGSGRDSAAGLTIPHLRARLAWWCCLVLGARTATI